MAIIVTGGAGFIRSNFVLNWINTSDEAAVNRNKIAFTRNLHSLACQQVNTRRTFVWGGIFDFNYLLQSNPL